MSNTAVISDPHAPGTPSRSPEGGDPGTKSAAPRRGSGARWGDLMARYQTISPGRRWLVLGGLVVLIYLFADDFSWRWAGQLRARGDRIESALKRYASRQPAGSDLRSAVALYGPINPPLRRDAGSEALARAIDDVLRKHDVTGHAFESRAAVRLKDADPAVFGAAGLDRLQAEVKFEASGDKLPAILADLEANPSVAAISSIRIQKVDPPTKRLVSVQATIETWVLAGTARRQP